MAFNFKIWNQGNDGSTMGVRVEDVAEVARFAAVCDQPDIAGHWSNLQKYIDVANAASGAPPNPYTRIVNVVWLSGTGYGGHRYFPGVFTTIRGSFTNSALSEIRE